MVRAHPPPPAPAASYPSCLPHCPPTRAYPIAVQSIGGVEGGKWYGASHPGWQDASKPAGHTSQLPIYGQPGWWKSTLTTESFFMSPNLVW
jgi:hypothetical protein